MNQSAFTSPQNRDLLSNRYQLKGLIGRGGMGEVFLADDILLGGIPVAIKFLSHTVSSEKMKQDFAREALMSAALSQKSIHIVRANDYGVSEEGKPFYVMEYLNGKSLKELIPLPLSQFITLARQICLGLQCAHQGINLDGKIYPLVHRDIKPANILVIPDTILGQLVKILDFGIAKFLNSATTTSSNKGFNGTLPYSSPEQLEGGELDSRSDIYSLGVLMFEMLTGAKPWTPETDLFGAWYKAHHFEAPKTIADVNPQLKIPHQLHDLIMACLEKTPSDRPQDMTVILQVLSSVEKYICPNCPPTTLTTPTTRKPSVTKLPFFTDYNSQQLQWPENKPIQEIVFPQLLETAQANIATLCLMLSEQEIKKRVGSQVCQQFMFITSPHPMLLWVTALYSPKFGPKWLPCYLDMQNTQNQRLVEALAENEYYPLMCFTLEPPHSCIKILSSQIDPHQRQMLSTWVVKSKNLPINSEAHLSKSLLKQHYKQIQPQMLQQMALNPQIVIASGKT